MPSQHSDRSPRISFYKYATNIVVIPDVIWRRIQNDPTFDKIKINQLLMNRKSFKMQY